MAYYRLALFHDNNAREAEAIPNYERALRLGLPGETRAQAFAWLASSLHKTGSPRRAIRALRESRSLTSDPKLRKFLAGLEARIARDPKFLISRTGVSPVIDRARRRGRLPMCG